MKSRSWIWARVSSPASGEPMFEPKRIRWSSGGRVAAVVALAVFLLAFPVSASAQVDLGTLQTPDPTSSTAGPVVAPHLSYPGTASTPPTPAFNDGQVIVRFREGVSQSTQRRLHHRLGTRVFKKLLLPHTYVVKFNRHRDPRRVAAAYKRRPGVKYAEPNFIRTYDSTFPNDPSFGEQWALHN